MAKKSLWQRLWHDRRGNALIMVGAAAPVLVGSAGIAVDTIQWTLLKRQLQRAADSAALAGGYQSLQNNSESSVFGAVRKDLSLNNHAGALVAGFPLLSRPADNGDFRQQVRVELATDAPLLFSSMFKSGKQRIVASATSATTGLPDNFCVISLEPSTYSGIYGSGSATVQMDCGMITNSRSRNSAIAKGSADIHASVIASVGGIQQSENWHVGKYAPYSLQQPDPFADVEPERPSSCIPGGVLRGSKAGTTAVPGCYSSIDVGSNTSLKLGSGNYFVNGGSVQIQGNLSGDGVSIALSNIDPSPTAQIGNFSMNGSGTINLTAPTDPNNPMQNIAIYQDRRAQTDGSVTYDPAVDYGGNLPNNSPNKINGNSASAINGAIYFPKQRMVWNGTGAAATTCTQFVVRQIVFNGNNSTSNFTANCSMYDPDRFRAVRRVRLVG